MQTIKEHYLNSFKEYLKIRGIDTENINPRYKTDGKLYFDDAELNKILDEFAFIFKTSFEFGRGIGFTQGYEHSKNELVDLVKVKICRAISEVEL